MTNERVDARMGQVELAVFRTSLTTASIEPRFSVPSLTLREFSMGGSVSKTPLPVRSRPNSRYHPDHLECPLQSKSDRDPAVPWVSSLVMAVREEWGTVL